MSEAEAIFVWFCKLHFVCVDYSHDSRIAMTRVLLLIFQKSFDACAFKLLRYCVRYFMILMASMKHDSMGEHAQNVWNIHNPNPVSCLCPIHSNFGCYTALSCLSLIFWCCEICLARPVIPVPSNSCCERVRQHPDDMRETSVNPCLCQQGW